MCKKTKNKQKKNGNFFVVKKIKKGYNNKKMKGTREKMYKLIAVDLDGTMLNSYGEVTENTKRVIKQTIQKGVDVIRTATTKKIYTFFITLFTHLF